MPKSHSGLPEFKIAGEAGDLTVAEKIQYERHSDDVSTKLRLLTEAYRSGNYDLAMSLSDSVKETLSFERQRQAKDRAAGLGGDQFIRVRDLPAPWAAWAEGWQYCLPLSFFETVGIARSQEPVDLQVIFRTDQVVDPRREVRVVCVDAGGTLREISSQLDDVSRQADRWEGRLVFLADVPMHGQASYLIFAGNPYAELPRYETDLRTTGEGYGLEIANNHFVAKLSNQMGQLERLIYKRQHGLELYAGGKGHGEPPMIDWAHDYVDENNMQKLRMRNWPRCPNHDVVRGPLCVRVRRWGFPYSPLHPVLTPARIHADQTYIFYAGVPYFFKEGSMEAIQDVRIHAMRDDEWVFSGYSFTDPVWFDRAGKMHTGPVPPSHAQDLWGVGFFHRDSRDAFVALWLEHKAENFAGIGHNGSPAMHYDGHGQLWSRYPARETELKTGTRFWQRNAYMVIPYPREGAEGEYERWRHRFLNPLEVQVAELITSRAAPSPGHLARYGETLETAPLKPAVWKALEELQDEQFYSVDANMVALGLIYDVRVRSGVVHIVMTMPHRGRPVYEFFVTQGGGRVQEGIMERVRRIEGVRDVVVEFTWEPAWNVHRMSSSGLSNFGLV